MEDVFKTLGDALNPNQKENVKPLYKRLDEERTQGKWLFGNTTILERPALWIGGTRILVADEVPHEILSGTANAQYTALAVNNLAPLAEALENFISLYEDLAKDFNQRLDNEVLLCAKEALSKIS